MQTDNGHPVNFINDDSGLEECCSRWRELQAIALDTEFVRTNTFYPKLGLIQVADEEATYIIDPLKISQWQPFVKLLESGSCEVVLHSAGEDLVLLLTSLQCLPASLFDTQVAAGLLGFGFSQSYQSLVADVLNVEIAKDETRSDWLKRPLSETQLQYAANDVCYLLAIRKRLRADLATKNKLAWFESECRQMLEQASEFENQDAWAFVCNNISNAWRLNDEGLAALQRLCIWREKEARRRDKPRSWIANDNELYAMAEALDKSAATPDMATLQQAREVSDKFLDRNGQSLLATLTDDSLGLPTVDRAELNPPLVPEQRKLLKKIQKLSRDRAEKLNIAPELLAKRKEIIKLLRNYPESGELNWDIAFSRWRQEVLQEDVDELVATDGERRND